jgi:CubicO group peptidase (beta-lactamase class C family)
MKKMILLLLLISLLLVNCEQNASRKYTYLPPEKINDGLEVGSLPEVNIDSMFIENAVDSINYGRYQRIHSLLIFKDNRLVLEEYFEGHKFKYDTIYHHGEVVNWDRKMIHKVMSVTKSITSVCIGIAVDKGYIESVDQSIFDYLPEYQHLNKDGKNKISIEHLLTMTSGLEWNEWRLPYSHPENDVIRMYLAEDAVSFVLNKPLLNEPGTSFLYAGGCNILLGEILKNATKMNIDEFSGKYLFGPLGISPYYWDQYNNGTVDAAGSIRITPRDMVKIGVTFLNNGIWKNHQVISKEWVEKSATSYAQNKWTNNWGDYWGMKGYAYSWWTHQFVKAGKRINMYYAAGWGGQYIMVIPDLNTVVVFTGGNYITQRPSFEILKKYILPAFK